MSILSMCSVSTRCCLVPVLIGELIVFFESFDGFDCKTRREHPCNTNFSTKQKQNRLQQGMRGAWGKPHGTAARVDIGQVLISVRTRDNNKAVVIEALRRCKYKFAGRQKLIVSNKWGFTKLTREEYVTQRQAGKLQPDGCYVKYLTEKGPLDAHFKRLERA